jgi:hypothetical protein
MKTIRYNVEPAFHGDPAFAHMGSHGGFSLTQSHSTLAKAKADRAKTMQTLFAWRAGLAYWPLLAIHKTIY